MKFEIHAISVNNLSKFQAQDSFWNNLFGRLGDLKNESHFLKKSPFSKSKKKNT